jgi:hypothetical protein
VRLPFGSGLRRISYANAPAGWVYERVELFFDLRAAVFDVHLLRGVSSPARGISTRGNSKDPAVDIEEDEVAA